MISRKVISDYLKRNSYLCIFPWTVSVFFELVLVLFGTSALVTSTCKMQSYLILVYSCSMIFRHLSMSVSEAF
jgi:hypothetical protein